jgi:hypothetical protein
MKLVRRTLQCYGMFGLVMPVEHSSLRNPFHVLLVIRADFGCWSSSHEYEIPRKYQRKIKCQSNCSIPPIMGALLNI